MPLDTSKQINRVAGCLCMLVLTACVTSTERKQEDAANIYLQLGVRYLTLNKLEVAKENLERALNDDSSNVQALNAMAFLYEKLNKYDDARKYYETASSLAPDDLGVQNNFGRFLCNRGDFQKGMTLLTAVSVNPLNDQQWLALTNAGRCQLALKQTQKAKTYFKQALQVNPAYAPALLEMQKISYQNGEYWAAKGYLQRYLAVADYTSESLWFAILTERELGNESEAIKYQNLLLEKYPLSNEAKLIRPVQ